MNKLILPRTDLEVSSLCYGTAELGATVNQQDSFTLLDTFVEGGGNFLDTALIYAAWLPAGQGSSEKLIGEWLRSRKPTDFVVATKGGHMDLNTLHKPRLSPRYLRWDVENSLRHMGTSAIDLYYLHRDDPKRPVEEILATLEEMVADGKIRYYACSNWSQKRMEAARIAAAEAGAHGFVANQPLWSLARTDMTKVDTTLIQMDDALLAWHQKHELAVVPYSSQAGGFFSKLAAGQALEELPAALQSPLNLARYQQASDISREMGRPVSHIVLAYLLSQPLTVVPIIGGKTVDQLRDSMAAADLRLTPSQLDRLTAPPTAP